MLIFLNVSANFKLCLSILYLVIIFVVYILSGCLLDY